MWKSLSVLALALLASWPAAARAQMMSVEEAEARMKMRQAARASMASTQPTSRPTTMPAAMWELVLEDQQREASLDHFMRNKPEKKQEAWSGLISTLPPAEWQEQPEIFGSRMRNQGHSGGGGSGGGDVYVHGYYRRDGTYVHGYYRGRPDGIKSNNKR